MCVYVCEGVRAQKDGDCAHGAVQVDMPGNRVKMHVCACVYVCVCIAQFRLSCQVSKGVKDIYII